MLSFLSITASIIRLIIIKRSNSRLDMEPFSDPRHNFLPVSHSKETSPFSLASIASCAALERLRERLLLNKRIDHPI